MKCPCEECLKFPLCLNQRDVRCKDLYEFVAVTNPIGFVRHKKIEIKYTSKLFKRKLSATTFISNMVSFRERLEL